VTRLHSAGIMQFLLVCVISPTENGIGCAWKGGHVVWGCTVWAASLQWGCRSETRFHCAGQS